LREIPNVAERIKGEERRGARICPPAPPKERKIINNFRAVGFFKRRAKLSANFYLFKDLMFLSAMWRGGGAGIFAWWRWFFTFEAQFNSGQGCKNA